METRWNEMEESKTNGGTSDEEFNLEEIPLILDPTFAFDGLTDSDRAKYETMKASQEPAPGKEILGEPLQENGNSGNVVMEGEASAKIPGKEEPLERIIASDLNNGFKQLSQKYPMVSFRKVDRRSIEESELPVSTPMPRPQVSSSRPSKEPIIQVYKSSKELLSSPEHRAMPKLESLVLSGYSNHHESCTKVELTPRNSKSIAPPSPPHLSPQVSVRSVKSSKRKSHSSSPEEKPLDLFSYYSKLPKSITVETYYCGELEGKPFSCVAFPPDLRCFNCEKAFESNVDVYAHMYNHGQAKLSSGSVLCPYCMKSVPSDELGNHVKNMHHMIEAGCCRICERKFAEEFQLVIHMWANHCRYDMPYACGICDYRSSLKFQVVDHFNMVHQGSAAVLCPLCLQVLPCESKTHLTEIFAHSQLHQFSEGHRCGHCSLVFSQQSELRAHFQGGFHTSKRRARNSRAVIPYRNLFGVKLSLMPKPPPQFCDDYDGNNDSNGAKITSPATHQPRKLFTNRGVQREEAFDKMKLRFNISKERCLECGWELRVHGHFAGRDRCTKCGYHTCCKNAMRSHARKVICKPAEIHAVFGRIDPDSEWLVDKRFKCDCGFSTVNPDRFAFHIARKCEKVTGILSS